MVLAACGGLSKLWFDKAMFRHAALLGRLTSFALLRGRLPRGISGQDELRQGKHRQLHLHDALLKVALSLVSFIKAWLVVKVDDML